MVDKKKRKAFRSLRKGRLEISLDQFRRFAQLLINISPIALTSKVKAAAHIATCYQDLYCI